MAATPLEQSDYSDNFVTAVNAPVVETYDPCSCVSFAKWRMGVSQSERWGNASEIVPNDQKPSEKGVVVLNEGTTGHLAYYELSGGVLRLEEVNYYPCQYSEREIPIDYPLIKGYL